MDLKTATSQKIFINLLLTLALAVGVFFFLKTIFPITKGSNGNCGPFTKVGGFKSYFYFLRNNKITVPPDNVPAKCYYEFYEGIYEASTVFGNHYKNLENICAYINGYLPIRSWNQCFFKLGTALIYSKRTEVRNPDKLQALVDSRVKFCEGLENNRIDCIVGVYTGIDLGFINKDNDSVFPVKNNDPFWLCKVGAGLSYKINCYRNTVSFIYKFTEGDMNKAVKIFDDNLPNALERFEIKLTYFSSLAYLETYKYSDIHKLCLSFPDRETRYSCIEGYATGLDEVLPNGKEGSGIVEYCLNSPLSFDEKGECVRRGFFELPTANDLDVKRKACESLVPAIFKNYCDVEKAIPLAH